MEADEIKFRKLEVVIHIAILKTHERKVYADFKTVSNNIQRTGLEEAQTLIRLADKLVQEYNSKLDTQLTKIKALNYLTKNVFSSRLIKSFDLDLKKIEKAIIENPSLDTWDVSKKFI